MPKIKHNTKFKQILLKRASGWCKTYSTMFNYHTMTKHALAEVQFLSLLICALRGVEPSPSWPGRFIP